MLRMSMTMPKSLINELDEVLKEQGYNSRRNGLQDIIESYVNENKKHIKIKQIIENL